MQGQARVVRDLVVDVDLAAAERVPLFSQLGVTGGGALCVVAQPDERTLRCVRLPDAPPTLEGSAVQSDSRTWRKELDTPSLARVSAALSRSTGTLLETGIKSIDFLCPLARGGVLGVFGGVSVSIIAGELRHRLGDSGQLHIACLVPRADFDRTLNFRTAETEMLGPWDRLSGVDVSYVPAQAANDPITAGTESPFDATLYASQAVAARGEYPPLDGAYCRSRLLDGAASGEHTRVWRRFQTALAEVKADMTDAVYWELMALRATARAEQRRLSFESARLAQLDAAKRQLVERVRKVERFLTQPLFVAAPFVGVPGTSVPLAETVQTVAAILDGHFDNVAAKDLYMKGSVALP